MSFLSPSGNRNYPSMLYKLVKRVNPEKPKEELLMGPQVVYRDEVGFDRLCQEISMMSILSASDVAQVLEALLANALVRLENSEAFDLGHLGVLKCVIKTDLVEDPLEYTAGNVRKVRVAFMPGARFRRLINATSARMVKPGKGE